MNRKLIFGLTLVFVLSLIITVVAIAKTELTYLKIINKTDLPVTVSLSANGDSIFYILTVGPDQTKTYTVSRKVYDRTTYACGRVDSGTVDIRHQFRMVFTNCNAEAPNWGEPTQEKIHIDDSPGGINWLYK
jgi:hypothetical protein